MHRRGPAAGRLGPEAGAGARSVLKRPGETCLGSVCKPSAALEQTEAQMNLTNFTLKKKVSLALSFSFFVLSR